jgi:CBS domain-containing protein
MASTARDIMTPGVECARLDDTVAGAARRMRDLGVGALPVCDEEDRLLGMITDRDIVLGCVADGHDPTRMKVGEYVGDHVVTVDGDDSLAVALATMTAAGVRRLPVVDGRELVGTVSQADIARHLPPDMVGGLVAAIASAPDNA